MDGVHYHFYPSKAAMQADISSGKFLDVIVQSDHFYATSMQSVLEVLQSGRICILDVNIVAIYRLQVGDYLTWVIYRIQGANFYYLPTIFFNFTSPPKSFMSADEVSLCDICVVKKGAKFYHAYSPNLRNSWASSASR